MQCCKCKKELQDGVLFCKYCGARQPTQQKDVERDETTQHKSRMHSTSSSQTRYWVMERLWLPTLPKQEKGKKENLFLRIWGRRQLRG